MRRCLWLLVAVPLVAACNPLTALSVYRMEIQQGNYISQEAVSQLKPGMTKDQVRFVLGTPLVADIFHENRWDYVYRRQRREFQRGRGAPGLGVLRGRQARARRGRRGARARRLERRAGRQMKVAIAGAAGRMGRTLIEAVLRVGRPRARRGARGRRASAARQGCGRAARHALRREAHRGRRGRGRGGRLPDRFHRAEGTLAHAGRVRRRAPERGDRHDRVHGRGQRRASRPPRERSRSRWRRTSRSA